MIRKKDVIYWLVAILPFVITCAWMPFLKERVPIHYNAEGVVDQWGSKYMYFVICGVLVVVSFFFYWMYKYYDKKICESDKETKKAESNSKVLYVVGIVITVFECFILAFGLLGAYKDSEAGNVKSELDLFKILAIGFGIVCVFIGNYMPKLRKNKVIGIRISFSMKNDKTWAVTHRYGGIFFVVGGLFMMLAGVILEQTVALAAMLVILFLVVLLSFVAAYRAYKLYGDE